MAKAASARIRGLGMTAISADYPARAAICERCPMRVIQNNITYCGTPFLSKIDRDPVLDGCGCPIRDKARSPAEHCPADARFQPATQREGRCNCRWCDGARTLTNR
jgi:hypothetical protein